MLSFGNAITAIAEIAEEGNDIMSLEAALTANTAALTQVAGLLAEGNKIRADLLSSAAGVTAAPKTRGKAATATAAAAAATPPANATGTGSAVLDAIMKEFGGSIGEEALRKEFGGYMGVTDQAEREKRKPNVVAILAEVGAAKATEIKSEDRAKAIYWVRKFAKGEKVDFKADLDDASGKAADEGEGDDLL